MRTVAVRVIQRESASGAAPPRFFDLLSGLFPGVSRRRWRGIPSAATLAAGLVLLPGCFQDRNSREETVVELNVLMGSDPGNVYHDLFDDFARQNPGIRIRYAEGPGATNTREDLYVTSFLSGDAVYDLVFADVVWVPKFAAAGWIEDLTDRWPAEKWKEFIASSVTGGSYRGRIYRLPVSMDCAMLFARTDLLSAAGESPPKTFRELARIAARLQHPDALWGYVWQGRQYEGLVCNFLEILTGFGGFWIDPQTNRVGLDAPEANAALRWMVDAIHKEKISPPGVTAYAEEDARRLFQEGRAVFERNWLYAYAMGQREDSPIRGKFSLNPMPAESGGRPASTLGGWGFCITTASRHKEAAWRFLEFVGALPQIARLAEGTGTPASLKAFYEQNSDPLQREIYTVLQTTVPRPPIPQYAHVSDILQRYLSAALTLQMTPTQALAGASRETRLLLEDGGDGQPK